MLSEAGSSRDQDRPSTPLLAQIILFDGFDLLDALGPYEVFQAAALVSEGSIKVELVSTEGARMVPERTRRPSDRSQRSSGLGPSRFDCHSWRGGTTRWR